MDTGKDFSFTRIGAYISCPKRYDYTYNLGLKRRTNIEQISNGIRFHDLIAAVMSAWYDIGHLTDEQIREVLHDHVIDTLREGDEYDTLEEAKEIVFNAVKSFDLSKWEIMTFKGRPLIEYEVNIPKFVVTEGQEYGLLCRIDLVARNKENGLVYLIDWKTSRKLGVAEMLHMPQLHLYRYALAQIGISTHAAMVYQVLYASPRVPTLNKNGAMSRSLITTTWDIYRNELVRHGLDPNDYSDMEEQLKDTSFVVAKEIFATLDELQSMWYNLQTWAIRAANDTEYPMNVGYSCGGCPFNELCYANLIGKDATGLVDELYITRDGANG